MNKFSLDTELKMYITSYIINIIKVIAALVLLVLLKDIILECIVESSHNDEFLNTFYNVAYIGVFVILIINGFININNIFRTYKEYNKVKAEENEKNN